METPLGGNHRGDEPAQAVISANKLSRVAREAEQTKEELQKIQRRVDQMIQAFEHTNLAHAGQQTGMEIVEDVDQLESILGDRVMKKKYQQQLTVFIVGYQETCGQRRYLLSQLQEFFSFYAKLAEEDTSMQTEELQLEMDGVADQVKTALCCSEMAMSRLTELNKQLVNYVNKVRCPATTNTKSKKSLDDKGRKKLEKAMEQAKEDLIKLTNKLLQAQEDVDSKDTRLKELLKQNEVKGVECQHFRAQLESTKKNLELFQEDYMMQRALLEAEVRRQVTSVSQLEEQLRAKEDLRRETASQWSDRAPSSTGTSGWEIDLDREPEAQEELHGIGRLDTQVQSEAVNQEDLQSPATQRLHSNQLGQELDQVSLDQAISRSPPESVLESFAEGLYREQSPTAPLPPSPIPAPPCTSHSDTPYSLEEGSLVLEGDSSHVESIPTKTPEEEADHRSPDSTPLPDLLEQPQHNGHPEEETTWKSPSGSLRSPDQLQDPPGISPATKQGSETPMSDKGTPAHSTNHSNRSGIPPTYDDRELGTELANVNRQHEQITSRLKTDFQVLAAQWEAERRGLLQQIQQAAKVQVVLERKVAFALKELHRMSSEPRGTPPAADPEQSMRPGDSSETTLPLPGKQASSSLHQSEGKSSTAGAPASPHQRPDSGGTPAGGGRAMEVAFDDGICRLHHGIRTLVESVKKGLLAQGLHSLTQLLDGGWGLDNDRALTAPGEDRKAEQAKSLELLQNITEVFHSLLESFSYHCGVPVRQGEVTSEKTQSQQQETKDDNDENGQRGLMASKNSSTAGRNRKRTIMISPAQESKREDDLNHAAETTTTGPASQAGVLFTHLDETHNRRVLDRGVKSGRVPRDLYQGAILAMDCYGQVRHERLLSLFSGYIRTVSQKEAIRRLRSNIDCRPEPGQTLTRLQKLQQQVLHRWREARCQSSERRLLLSVSLNKTLQHVEEQSGIFLIKPVLSWPGGAASLKSSARINAYLKAVPKNLTVSPHPTTGQEAPHLPASAQASCGINLSGISFHSSLPARGGTHKLWSAKLFETRDPSSAELNQGMPPSAMVITPKLLEMDVNSYMFDECRVSVMSQCLDCSAGSRLKPPGPAPLRNFLPVRRVIPVKLTYSEKQ